MCHDTKFCIVIEAARLLDCVATRLARPRHDTGCAGSADRRWGVGAGARGRRHGHAGCDTADPSRDTARPRATIRPLCAPGRACARLGVLSWARLGVLCT